MPLRLIDKRTEILLAVKISKHCYANKARTGKESKIGNLYSISLCLEFNFSTRLECRLCVKSRQHYRHLNTGQSLNCSLSQIQRQWISHGSSKNKVLSITLNSSLTQTQRHTRLFAHDTNTRTNTHTHTSAGVCLCQHISSFMYRALNTSYKML